LSVTCDRSVVFSTNSTDCHDITEILLKVMFNTIKPNHPFYRWPNTENLNKMSSKWPPCSHIDFSRKYIVCISPSLNTTSLQIISSWIIPKHQYGCHSTILNCSCISTLLWPISLQNISSRFQPTYSNGR
jgi:hypothetical protein